MNTEKRSFDVRRMPTAAQGGEAWARSQAHGCSFCCKNIAEWLIIGNFGPSHYICQPCLVALHHDLNQTPHGPKEDRK